ncbi:The fantastic four family [Arabidopsis thaliana x Arabidopsis arenosa]|uniref:The fantastic four family n=1 Tax=Arabidopsis thaliana x Arabidopsis arenosa TaxID=1240361 RepID=A0A8T2ARC8_9BRAS|nr:The fantastic four family [Arabidopsis thaliana x Arabidopsis arenosa]
MATVVYQSYFESQHFEPRALRLRLSSHTNPHLSTPLKSHFQDSSIAPQDNTTTINAASLSLSGPNPGSNSDANSGSWSFLESLSNSSSNDKEKKTLSLFQSPSSRRTLSDESLALCTESLGSETGSDIIHEDEDMFSISSELQTMETRTTSTTSKPSRQDRKRNMMASLPPPLASMRGFDCIEVKSHRENGRLVMTATRPPPRNCCLQDRSNGCVRLAILIDSDDHIETETKEEEEVEEETIETVRNTEEEIPEYEVEGEEEKDKGIKVKGVEKVQRSRRCIEGDRENRGFLNWESFCVATS